MAVGHGTIERRTAVDVAGIILTCCAIDADIENTKVRADRRVCPV